jgi:hypothetical protein
LDNGYDYSELYELLEDHGYTIYIRPIEEHKVSSNTHDTELDTGLLKELTPRGIGLDDHRWGKK